MYRPPPLSTSVSGPLHQFSAMSVEQQQQLNQQGLQLWDLTWHRIELFLPNLREEDPFKTKNLTLRQQYEETGKRETSTDGIPSEETTPEGATSPAPTGEEVEPTIADAAVTAGAAATPAVTAAAATPAVAAAADGSEPNAPDSNDAEEEIPLQEPTVNEEDPSVGSSATEAAPEAPLNPVAGDCEPPPAVIPMVVPPLPAPVAILAMVSRIETAPGVDIDEAFRPTVLAGSASPSSQRISSPAPPVVGNVILEAPTPISTPMIMTRTEL